MNDFNRRLEVLDVLAIDFGGTRIKEWRGGGDVVSIADADAISDEAEFVGLLKKRLAESPARSVAVALPMTILYSRGVRQFSEFQTKFVYFASKVVGNVEVSLTGQLGVPVFIDQDGRLCALFQAAEGPAKDFESSLTVAVGTSVSGGFFFHGKVWQGQMTSQLSHMVVHPGGEPCTAGHAGCLKTRVGKTARERLSKEMGLPLDSRAVYQLASQGDVKAIAFFKELAARLGDALTKILRALPVDCLVVAGGLANAGSLLIEPLKASLMRDLDKEFRIVVQASLEPESVVKGAAIYGREQLALRRAV